MKLCLNVYAVINGPELIRPGSFILCSAANEKGVMTHIYIFFFNLCIYFLKLFLSILYSPATLLLDDKTKKNKKLV